MLDQPVELKVYYSLEKQKGGMDCGVYCIVVCASLLHGASMNFSQSLLRPKLVSCFEKFHVSPFPMKWDVHHIHVYSMHTVVTFSSCT